MVSWDNVCSVDPIDFIEARCPVARKTDEKPRLPITRLIANPILAIFRPRTP